MFCETLIENLNIPEWCSGLIKQLYAKVFEIEYKNGLVCSGQLKEDVSTVQLL